MRDHWPTGNPMHDLGDRGFHSRAAARGKDDGGETGLAHRQLETDRKMSGCSLARHRRGYNSQIVAKYSTTTQSLSRWKGSSSSSTRLSAYSLSPLARLVRPSSVPNPRSSPAPHGVARRYG